MPRISSVAFTSLFLAGLAHGQSSANVPADVQQSHLEALTKSQNVRVLRVGAGISRVYGNVPMPGGTAEDSARNFVAMYGAAFGAYPEDLTLDLRYPIRHDLEMFRFGQTYQGLKVEGSTLTVVVYKDFPNAVVLASPRIRPVPTSVVPRLSGEAAQRYVRRAFPHADYIHNAELLIWGYTEEVGKLAYAIRAGTNNLIKPEKFKFFVDAMTGEILEKRSEVFFVDVNGTLQGYYTPNYLYPDSATNPPTLMPLGAARARIIGGNSVYANPNGTFTIPNPGSSAVTVEGALVGQWVTVTNVAGSNEVQTVNVTPPGPANLTLNPTQVSTVTAQINGLVHTDIVRNFAKAINPAYPGIDIQMLCRVNLASTCNAYYDGNINFYAAGGGCVNTAYASVVYHEYGHHIVAMGHANPSGAYHEGVADVAATFILDDHIVGRDFSGPGTQVRNVDTPNVLYPCSGGSHQCGLVIGGAFWDTLRELKTTMGAAAGMAHARYLYLNQIPLSPAIDPGITIDVLTLDDNDGNVLNGTPHYNEINIGFTAHNLAAPPLSYLKIFTYPVDSSALPANVPIRINIRVQNDVGTYAHGSAKLFYRINGGAFQPAKVGAIPDNAYGLLQGTIPAQPVGTLIEWYVTANDTDGHTVWDLGLNTYHESLAASSLVTSFSDSFDTDLGWTVSNVSISTGAWERAIPNSPTRGEPPGAHTPSWAYVTDNRVGNFDVDGTTVPNSTTVTSPVFNATNNAIVSLAAYMYTNTGEDTLVLAVSNNGGSSWTTVKTWTSTNNVWETYSFVVSKYVTPTSNMRIRLVTGDPNPASVVEAGLDTVLVRRAQ